jgi:hypothetical protein
MFACKLIMLLKTYLIFLIFSIEYESQFIPFCNLSLLSLDEPDDLNEDVLKILSSWTTISGADINILSSFKPASLHAGLLRIICVVGLLFGSGEIPENSNYRFFNTFGKDFNKVFDVKRL